MPSNTPETQALEPCPLCGGRAELIDLGDPQDDSYVHCIRRSCGLQQIARYTPEGAIAAWNQRHRQSSNAASVGDEGSRLAAEWSALRPKITGMISDVECAVDGGAGEGIDALTWEGACDARAGVERIDAILASLSTPTAEPTSSCLGDGMLRAHFTRMMEAAANYLEPTTYVARHPQHGLNGSCRFTTEFPMPDENHSDSAKADINSRRDQAFISDMIYMLDGPEQRAALTTPPTPDRIGKDAVREALRNLLARDIQNTCQHEDTKRGGSIWEICNDCGAKWADDEGGKPDWQDPPEWTAARRALSATPAQEGEGDD